MKSRNEYIDSLASELKESSDKVWNDLRAGLADAMSKFKAPPSQ